MTCITSTCQISRINWLASQGPRPAVKPNTIFTIRLLKEHLERECYAKNWIEGFISSRLEFILETWHEQKSERAKDKTVTAGESMIEPMVASPSEGFLDVPSFIQDASAKIMRYFGIYARSFRPPVGYEYLFEPHTTNPERFRWLELMWLWTGWPIICLSKTLDEFRGKGLLSDEIYQRYSSQLDEMMAAVRNCSSEDW